MASSKGSKRAKPGVALPSPPRSPCLVESGRDFRLARLRTRPPARAPDDKECRKRLRKVVGRLDDLQRALYAENRHSLLCVFQAMDAAGKDSTIRAVFSGLNPAGFQVFSFKQPSSEELDHDFLWRTSRRLPDGPAR